MNSSSLPTPPLNKNTDFSLKALNNISYSTPGPGTTVRATAIVHFTFDKTTTVNMFYRWQISRELPKSTPATLQIKN